MCDAARLGGYIAGAVAEAHGLEERGRKNSYSSATAYTPLRWSATASSFRAAKRLADVIMRSTPVGWWRSDVHAVFVHTYATPVHASRMRPWPWNADAPSRPLAA
jgi:hypothetical protein